MPLLLTNKTTNEQKLYGSFVAIEKYEKINKQRLSYFFKKDGYYEDSFYKIERKEVKRSTSER